MDEVGTVLIVSADGAEWSAASNVLADEYGYRVLTARTFDAADHSAPSAETIRTVPTSSIETTFPVWILSYQA